MAYIFDVYIWRGQKIGTLHWNKEVNRQTCESCNWLSFTVSNTISSKYGFSFQVIDFQLNRI